MTALEIKAQKPRLGIVYPPPRNQFPQTNQKQNGNPYPQEGKKKIVKHAQNYVQATAWQHVQ